MANSVVAALGLALAAVAFTLSGCESEVVKSGTMCKMTDTDSGVSATLQCNKDLALLDLGHHNPDDLGQSGWYDLREGAIAGNEDVNAIPHRHKSAHKHKMRKPRAGGFSHDHSPQLLNCFVEHVICPNGQVPNKAYMNDYRADCGDRSRMEDLCHLPQDSIRQKLGKTEQEETDQSNDDEAPIQAEPIQKSDQTQHHSKGKRRHLAQKTLRDA
eukprot:gnl/TRDRNA2_/TRDRNA2_184864_c0_seq1.p1 gnl/TRDRNA2_/TRDRNA2_184864_c0~~gnl/TRDRNA2_/TRDRNA2_184864_c0_seq1.p1  ORF type:complete len:214 (-),score=42.93 gnl/TRDRNA2_/TRDRNA2_184864_c0_seq1:172-813(-)